MEGVHRAARDGVLERLREASRKEVDSRDADGMTPAMWAAYFGRLEALRIIVGRGGDPDKCDHYGNSPLHCAAGRGHLECVSFLVHFGANLWTLDNDFHSPKDVAVLNGRSDVLRLLDAAQGRHELVNRKLVQRLKEKSVYDAEQRVKSYRKRERKAQKKAAKEDRRNFSKKDARFPAHPHFSDIVNNAIGSTSIVKRASMSIPTRKKNVVFLPGDITRRETNRCPSSAYASASKYRVEEDDAENHSDASPDHTIRQSASDTQSSDDASSDVIHAADSGIGEDMSDPAPATSSAFHRSSLAHLNSRSSSVTSPSRLSRKTINDSIGSAGSLVRRHITWEDEYAVEDADDDATDSDSDETDSEPDSDQEDDPLPLVLARAGLCDQLGILRAQQLDAESLPLLGDEDLRALGLPLGPRRKLLGAVRDRTRVMRRPGPLTDSRL